VLLLSSFGFVMINLSHEPRLGSWPLEGPTPVAAQAPAPVPAESESPTSDKSIDNVTIARPSWHHGSGLLYGEITVKNRNPYSLKNVIVSCDFFDEWGNNIGSKGTALQRPIAPGRTRFSGLEFPMKIRRMQGGACHILSAERM
jgi:hypothetical protein